MRAVVRIALAYFGMLGVQSWINVAGLLFLAGAAAAFAFGTAPGAVQTVFALCVMGVVIILVIPVCGGGVGMRLGSRPGVLHLRPHGRLRLLLGTTLAVTLAAMLAALPSLAAHGFLVVHGFDPGTRFAPPLVVFGFAWTLFAAAFIYMFAVSWSLIGMMTFWMLPLAISQLARYVGHWASVVTLAQVMAFGLGAWALFALWYLRTGTIRRPVPKFGNSPNTMAECSPFQWLLATENARSDQPTRRLAISHYLLGCASNRLFVITGAWVGAIFLLLHFMGNERPRQPVQVLFMLSFLAFHFGAMAYATARRARLLWLRAGMSRKALFLLGERQALRASLITWAIVASLALVVTALPDPARIPQLLLYAGAQAVVCIAAFYAGFAIVKDWHVGDMLLFIVLGVLFVVQIVLGALAWRSGRLTVTAVLILVIAGILAIALRLHAARRWSGLDWRIARPLKLDSRRS
jgi:hypothetical protein